MYTLTLTLFLVMISTVVFAEPQSEFSVSGQGRIFYEPDAYDISFGLITENANIQACKQSHLAVIERVKQFLDKNTGNIISLKQKVTGLRKTWANKSEDRLFQFRTLYTARVKNTASLLPFQEGLISSGVTDISSLDLFSEKLPELLQQARKEAIKDAKAKAELAASELDWVLTGASNISFKEPNRYSNTRASENYGSRTYTYDISNVPKGTSYVTSEVSVTFTFEKKKKIENPNGIKK